MKAVARISRTILLYIRLYYGDTVEGPLGQEFSDFYMKKVLQRTARLSA